MLAQFVLAKPGAGLERPEIGVRGGWSYPSIGGTLAITRGDQPGTYPAGEHVGAALDLARSEGSYAYTLAEAPLLCLRAGPRLLVWSFDASIRGTGVGEPLSEHLRFSHVLPALGAEAEEPTGIAFVYQRLGGGVLASDRYTLEREGGLGVHASVARVAAALRPSGEDRRTWGYGP